MTGSTTVDALVKVKELAANTTTNLWGAAGDFLIVFILVVFFFSFAWYVGRGQLVAIMLAYYGAYGIYAAFLATPYSAYLPSAPPLTALLTHAGLYAAIGFAFYVILRRVVVSDFLYVGNVGLILLSFFAAAFLIALTYHVFPITAIYEFTPAIDLVFAPKEYFFGWFIAPALALFFLAR
jgi:hypothetical protein